MRISERHVGFLAVRRLHVNIEDKRDSGGHNHLHEQLPTQTTNRDLGPQKEPRPQVPDRGQHVLHQSRVQGHRLDHVVQHQDL